MSHMKRFAELVSQDIGHDGELTQKALRIAGERFKSKQCHHGIDYGYVCLRCYKDGTYHITDVIKQRHILRKEQ